MAQRAKPAAPPEDVVDAYMRQLGNLPLLSNEEEVFHTRAFCAARAELQQHLAAFPALILEHLARCRASDVIDRQGAGGDTETPKRRNRIVTIADALTRIVERLRDNPEDTSEAARTLGHLLHESTRKLLARYAFSTRFYEDVCDDLEQCHNTFTATDAADDDARQQARERILMPPDQLAARLETVRETHRRLDASRTALVEANLRLVISVARKYCHFGLGFPDVVQEGNLGLMQAVDRFEPERGHRFSTYAVWWIRQGITGAVASHSRTIRIPANMAQTLSRIRRAEQKLLQELGHEPSPKEIAALVDLEPERISALRKMEQQTISLQSTLGTGEDQTIGEVLIDQNTQQPDEIVGDRMLSEALLDVLHTLSDRERRIVICRFGLTGQSVMTLEELSGEFGVTHERIRQIEAAALKKLRHPSRRKYFDGYAPDR